MSTGSELVRADPVSVTGRAQSAAGAGYCAGELLLGKYRLEAPIAAGGVGEVWRAKNELLGSPVAVKLMLGDGGGHSELTVSRARLEARLASSVEHPAVCRALDFGLSSRGDPVVVSELLQGIGLDELLRRRSRLSATHAAQIMIPVLGGLAAAHERGVVHRDVKPSNIFIVAGAQGQQQPKLLDFGIARSTREGSRLTQTGLVTGTPDYMSPEQARGSKDIDWRSDVWSACATLYELVSGRPPFPGDNYNAVICSVLSDAPAPLRELAPAERGLAAVIERGLVKDREQRTQSARQLTDELSAFLLESGIEVDASGHLLRRAAQPDAPRRLPRAGVLWAALSLLAIPPLLAAGWCQPASRTAPVARQQQALAPEQQPVAPEPSRSPLPALLPRPEPPPSVTATTTAGAWVRPTSRARPRAAGPTILDPNPSPSPTASIAPTAPSAAPPATAVRSSEPPAANALGYDFGL